MNWLIIIKWGFLLIGVLEWIDLFWTYCVVGKEKAFMEFVNRHPGPPRKDLLDLFVAHLVICWTMSVLGPVIFLVIQIFVK